VVVVVVVVVVRILSPPKIKLERRKNLQSKKRSRIRNSFNWP